MILYHGSNTEIPIPQLKPPQRALDFGMGFYTTSSIEQATWWAHKTTNRAGKGVPTVSKYNVDFVEFSRLHILRFDGPNRAWLQFVTSCRREMQNENMINLPQWDVVYGPVADDKTTETLDLYLSGLYDEEYAIKRLQPQKLKDQYVFKTEQSLKMLLYLESILV